MNRTKPTYEQSFTSTLLMKGAFRKRGQQNAAKTEWNDPRYFRNFTMVNSPGKLMELKFDLTMKPSDVQCIHFRANKNYLCVDNLPFYFYKTHADSTYMNI